VQSVKVTFALFEIKIAAPPAVAKLSSKVSLSSTIGLLRVIKIIDNYHIWKLNLQGIVTNVDGDGAAVARTASNSVVEELDGRCSDNVIDSSDVITSIVFE
jgi:xanthosine utilization system XapX-like protein